MKYTKLIPALFLGMSLSACGAGDWLGKTPERPPLPGERISVLDFERDLRPEDSSKAEIFNPGAAQRNAAWPQAGGEPAHAMHHLALNAEQPKKIWSASIGSGARKNLPLMAQPVMAGKSILTLDTESRLSSFDTETGKRRWSVDISADGGKRTTINGGVAVDRGIAYVTAGSGEVIAVDAQNGEIKWREKLAAPSRAAPTIKDGRVYVTTLNNNLITLNALDGKILWEFAGFEQSTGLVGAASAAATSDMVIPAFSSGEIYALRSHNGSVAWSDNLSGALRLGGVSALSDIRGLPVIDGDTVYAISFGGRMAAIDLISGSRIWQRDIGGSKTPWVAGNRIFVISSDGQIVSLDKQSGAVVWVSQLARFKNAEERTDPIVWTGPMMAGGRLLAFSSDSRVAEIDPEKGTLIRQWSSGGDMSVAPIIANATLYILTDNGTLTAYK